MRNLILKFLLSSITFYQKYVSVYKKPSCRFLPTCSEYSKEAYKEWGVLKGTFLTIKRLLRCHPFTKQQVDMVPRRVSSVSEAENRDTLL